MFAYAINYPRLNTLAMRILIIGTLVVSTLLP